MEAAEMMEAFLKEFPHMRSIVDVLPQVQPLDDGVLTRVRVTKVEDGQS
jgi:hypothetical protein